MIKYGDNTLKLMVKIKQRLSKKTYMDLTPMIDIVFLLVIFFMTSSTLIKIKTINVDLPKAAKSDSDVKETVSVSIDKDENIFISGKQVASAEAEAALRALVEKNDTKSIVVEGYQGVSYQRIIEVMSLAKKAGVEKVSLAVEQQ